MLKILRAFQFTPCFKFKFQASGNIFMARETHMSFLFYPNIKNNLIPRRHPELILVQKKTRKRKDRIAFVRPFHPPSSSSSGGFIILILFRSQSQSSIHIYEKQESKKDVPCAKYGLANICAGTCTRFQPFIDLLTRRHPTVLFLHSLSLCLLFFYRLYCVNIKRVSRVFA